MGARLAMKRLIKMNQRTGCLVVRTGLHHRDEPGERRVPATLPVDGASGALCQHRSISTMNEADHAKALGRASKSG